MYSLFQANLHFSLLIAENDNISKTKKQAYREYDDIVYSFKIIKNYINTCLFLRTSFFFVLLCFLWWYTQIIDEIDKMFTDDIFLRHVTIKKYTTIFFDWIGLKLDEKEEVKNNFIIFIIIIINIFWNNIHQYLNLLIRVEAFHSI